jgi:Spy/CpxP family protein refolding chaperone
MVMMAQMHARIDDQIYLILTPEQRKQAVRATDAPATDRNAIGACLV